MKSIGWVMLYRNIQDNWVWKDKPFSKGQAWIDLLLLANHEDKKFYHDGKIIEGKRGVVYRSISALSERWGWSRMKAKRFLDVLEADSMVIQNSTTHGTTITIVNYSDYQDSCATENTMDGQRTSSGRAAVEQRSSTYNNYNNDNNIEFTEEYTSISKPVGGGVGSWKNIEGVPQPTVQNYEDIVKDWNEIPHTLKIREIIPGTKREDEVRVVIGMYGYEGLIEAIQRVKDSKYLQRRGHVQFDNYINRNVVAKILEGSYDQDYKGGGDEDGLPFGC